MSRQKVIGDINDIIWTNIKDANVDTSSVCLKKKICTTVKDIYCKRLFKLSVMT